MIQGGAVRIEGHDELRRKIRRLEDGVDQTAAKGDLKSLNLAAATLVQRRAVQIVPRRSGVLASTLRAAGAQKSARVRAGYARVPYAGPIHFGWRARNIEPQPFLYDALDARRAEVFQTYDRGMAAIIKKYDL